MIGRNNTIDQPFCTQQQIQAESNRCDRRSDPGKRIAKARRCAKPSNIRKDEQEKNESTQKPGYAFKQKGYSQKFEQQSEEGFVFHVIRLLHKRFTYDFQCLFRLTTIEVNQAPLDNILQRLFRLQVDLVG